MIATQNPFTEQLQKKITTLEVCNQTLENEITYLKEQLEWLKRNLFGKRSEKIIPPDENQLEFDGFGNLREVETVEKKIIAAHTRQKPKRDGKDKITLPADIPVETTVIDIPEEQKVCPKTGKALVKIGEEITCKLSHKPGSYFIKKIIRPKYALPGNIDSGISIASLTGSLLTRCFADESLLADIMVKKYADHLPLYRQSEILSREKIFISRQLLCQWILRAGLALKPLQTLMTKMILESGNVFVDETPIKMLAPGKGKTKEAYVWVLALWQKQGSAL